MNGLALFAGYGGLELGIDAAFGSGVRTVCYVERESYAAATLVARMEESSLHKAPIWDDVTTFDGRPWRGTVDIISAGFPCQPFSAAGKQKGTSDERWLWDDIARIIREIRPRWFVGENVPGLVRLGLDPVLRSLAEMGYDVSWGAFRADRVGASHKRERIFILARLAEDADGLRRRGRHDGDTVRRAWEIQAQGLRSDLAEHEQLADSASEGREKRRQPGVSTRHTETGAGVESEPQRQFSELADTGGERRQQVAGSSHGDEVKDARRTSQHDHLASSYVKDLADAGCIEPQGEDAGRQPAEQELGATLPLFAPGPANLNLWARVLAEAPSLEPSLCRMVDGAAERLDGRQDRLRSCGNGVVPLQAAVAVRVLADRAGWELT